MTDSKICNLVPEPGRPHTTIQPLTPPVVGAYFMDSDIGVVEAAIDSTTTWSGVLDRACAADMGAPLDQWPVGMAVSGALAWSRAAGLTPDPVLIEASFTQSRPFAEYLYRMLLAGLGVPGARLAEFDDGDNELAL